VIRTLLGNAPIARRDEETVAPDQRRASFTKIAQHRQARQEARAPALLAAERIDVHQRLRQLSRPRPGKRSDVQDLHRDHLLNRLEALDALEAAQSPNEAPADEEAA
jgi:hypothetical protein